MTLHDINHWGFLTASFDLPNSTTNDTALMSKPKGFSTGGSLL